MKEVMQFLEGWLLKNKKDKIVKKNREHRQKMCNLSLKLVVTVT